MLDIVRQAGISEVILLFVLVFVIPMTGYLLLRLRRYESQFGRLAAPEKKKKKKKEAEPAPEKSGKRSVPPDVFPYQAKVFIPPPERACLNALTEAIGGDIAVYVKVALWELVEATDKNPGYFDRLTGKSIDFLICDASTGKPFTAACFEPPRNAPRRPVEELEKICKAAGLHLVFLPVAEEYDAKTLKKTLEIPDLSLN